MLTNEQARRVRQVRLTACEEGLIRRGAILLEDALRTASAPTGEQGKLLIVRSLSVGSIHPQQSSASLALTIEQRLHQLRLLAVHAEEPAARTAPAVYFHDMVEPYVRLVIRIAAQQNTDEWFWPLATPAWRPGMSRDEALRMLLTAVLNTQAGVAAVAILVRRLVERGIAQPLLAALRWQEGSFLLRACGWSKPSLPITFVEPLPSTDVIPPSLRDIVESGVRLWGTDDERSLWFATVSLLAEHPSRLLDPHLTQWAQRLIRRLSSQQISSQVGAPSRDEAQPGISPAVSARTATVQREAIGQHVMPQQEQRPPHYHKPAYEKGSQPQQEILSPELSAISDEVVTSDKDKLLWPQFSQRTQYGGFFFLLPVLSRLGIEAWLRTHPQLLEAQFVGHLLTCIAQRLLVPTSDPLWMAFPGVSGEGPDECTPFIVPEVWRHGICAQGPWRVRRVHRELRTRLLVDGSGRLPLAVWQGKATEEVRKFIADQTLLRQFVPTELSSFQTALRAWLTAVRRWCRRYAQLGLRSLICRSGRVVVTPTHVDVIFDHQQADIRIRKAGLDLNPGWIPWLGRVVQFHYLYGEQQHGA